jgi:hypothetical protein
MKNKYRVFKIALLVSLTSIITMFGTGYGASFMVVFLGFTAILGWLFFLRNGSN